jgi:hypothetical protein
MDELELLRQYAARTASTEPPAVDVGERVLATIRSSRPQSESLSSATRPLWLAMAASLLVAGTLGIYAQQLVADWQDPLASLFTPFLVTLQ